MAQWYPNRYHQPTRSAHDERVGDRALLSQPHRLCLQVLHHAFDAAFTADARALPSAERRVVWEDGVHVLRPDGLPVEVTRHLDGDQLIWRYIGFSARLDRIGPADMEA